MSLSAAYKFIESRAKHVDSNFWPIVYQKWVDDDSPFYGISITELRIAARSLLESDDPALATSAFYCLMVCGGKKDVRLLAESRLHPNLEQLRPSAMEFLIVRRNIQDYYIEPHWNVQTQNCTSCSRRIHPDPRFPDRVCSECEGASMLDRN